MSQRVSSSKRIKMQSAAEVEVTRYAGNHALWHKHIHNVELDSVQILKMKEMDEHPNTIDFSTRRGGKTAVKELYSLEMTATKPDQELGIVAPREAQAIVNLNYHLDAIRRSDILSAHVAHKSGHIQMSDTRYEFANRSKAQAYGIMAQVDGGDMTMASLEEVDDMPKERLYARFLLMLGSARRLGASKSSENNPQIRVTGVFKGADTLTGMLDTGTYHAIGCFHGDRARAEIQRLIADGYLDPLAVDPKNYRYPMPILNAANGVALGMLNENFINNIKADMSEDEFIRQLLCINTASRNLVWELYMRRALQVGLDARMQLAGPLPGEKYKRRGLVSFGYDHSGHGERPESSKYALVVLEQIGSYTCTIYAKTWAPGTDENVVRKDLFGLWDYFMPDEANGDAFGIGLLTQLNEELFNKGLTTIDRRAINDGDSTASTWGEWAFSPLRFEGMIKHQMAQAVRNVFHAKQAAIPYFDDHDMKDQDLADIRLLTRQITNIKPIESKTSYSLYKMADAKLGDDLFDAYMAAQWGLVTRGAGIVMPVIQSVSKNANAVLHGQQTRRLPSDPMIINRAA